MDKLYNQAFQIVKDSFNLSEEDVLKRNLEDCVNARYTLFGSICKYYTDTELSKLSLLSRSLINKIRNTVYSRLKSSYTFRRNFNEINGKISCLYQ